MHLLLNILFL